MHNGNAGHQYIGCEVSSCTYHSNDDKCELNKIIVRPCDSCSSGKAEEETLCGSYRVR